MNADHDEQKTIRGKHAGSIQQYSTIGGRKSSVESLAFQQSGSQEVQQSEGHSFDEQEKKARKNTDGQGKGGRKQKTVYLSPGLARRLNMYAAESEQEISEIAEIALDEYLTRLGK